MNTIFDITTTTPAEPVKGIFEKFFDCLADWSGHRYYATKETYTHDDESDIPVFKYKYLVEVIEPEYYEEEVGEGGDENSVRILLSLMILPECVTKEQVKKVASFCGIEEKEVTITDLYEYGLYCLMEDDEFDNRENSVEDALDCAATVIPVIDSLRGFYLDRPRNMIGTNGWDIIRQMTLNEDPYKKSSERMLKRMEKMRK